MTVHILRPQESQPSLLTLSRHQDSDSVMSRDGNGIAVAKATQALARPHILQSVSVCAESGDVRKVDCVRGRRTIEVHHEEVRSFGGLSCIE